MSEEPRRGEDEERGPGGVHHMFVMMEELLEKLKILDYEEEVLAAHNMKAMSRYDTATEDDSVSLRGVNLLRRLPCCFEAGCQRKLCVC